MVHGGYTTYGMKVWYEVVQGFLCIHVLHKVYNDVLWFQYIAFYCIRKYLVNLTVLDHTDVLNYKSMACTAQAKTTICPNIN